MVVLKTSRELKAMREAGRISRQRVKAGGARRWNRALPPGKSTRSSASISRDGAVPSFLGYGGFPGQRVYFCQQCGHPRHTVQEVRCEKRRYCQHRHRAHFNGFHGDNAWTFPCGDISEEARALLDATRESLFEGIKMAKAGNRIGDIGSAVQRYVEARQLLCGTRFCRHGVGAKLHEDPSVPNFGTPGRGVRLLPGMTIAIEPMVNAGTYEVEILSDEWTTVTADGKLSAHFEHSVAITPDGPQILTLPDD